MIGGKATPAPPVGPALGSFISNIASFCKEFNSLTNSNMGIRVTVDVYAFSDKSYRVQMLGVPTVDMIKQKLGLESGSSKPNILLVGSIDQNDLLDIAKQKAEVTGDDIDSLYKSIVGTAKSMGVAVK